MAGATHPGERAITVMLSPAEFEQLAGHAREAEVEAKYYASDLVRLALWERRTGETVVARREQEVRELRARVTELQRALLVAKAEGAAQ